MPCFALLCFALLHFAHRSSVVCINAVTSDSLRNCSSGFRRRERILSKTVTQIPKQLRRTMQLKQQSSTCTIPSASSMMVCQHARTGLVSSGAPPRARINNMRGSKHTPDEKNTKCLRAVKTRKPRTQTG